MTAKPLETIQIKSKNFWKSLVKAKRIKKEIKVEKINVRKRFKPLLI